MVDVVGQNRRRSISDIMTMGKEIASVTSDFEKEPLSREKNT
jgi:hypothetical protein